MCRDGKRGSFFLFESNCQMTGDDSVTPARLPLWHTGKNSFGSHSQTRHGLTAFSTRHLTTVLCRLGCSNGRTEDNNKKRTSVAGRGRAAAVSTLTEAKADWTLLPSLRLIFNKSPRLSLLFTRTLSGIVVYLASLHQSPPDKKKRKRGKRQSRSKAGCWLLQHALNKTKKKTWRGWPLSFSLFHEKKEIESPALHRIAICI